MSVCLAAGSIGCGGQAPAAAPPSGEQQTAESTQTAGTETPAPDNLVRGGVGDGQYKESPLVHEQVERESFLRLKSVFLKSRRWWRLMKSAHMEEPMWERHSAPAPDRLIQRACASSHF